MTNKAVGLVEYLAKALVTDPDSVNVTVVEKGRNTILELRVAPQDMGRVIGKQGRIAKAIRSVVKSATSQENTKYTVDIVE